jgi:hypothetical protein
MLSRGAEATHVDRLMAAAPIPARSPPYGTVTADRLGMLWIREPSRPGSESTRWIVSDQEGGIVETVNLRFAGGVSMLDADSSRAIFAATDSMGVHRVLVTSRSCQR